MQTYRRSRHGTELADIPIRELPTRGMGKMAAILRKSSIRRPPTGRFVHPLSAHLPMDERLAKLQTQLDLLKVRVRQAQQLSHLGVAAAMIAHEVNNLLTPIVGYAQTALDAADCGLHRKALTVTLKSAQVLIRMSERILQITAPTPPQRGPVALRPVVEDALASLCRDPQKDGITLSVKVDEAASVWADRLQLQQVFFNLFLNAREAMTRSHSAVLAVSAARHDDAVRIEVRNTGEPIARELLPHIFDPLQSSKSVAAGERRRCTGLGLALCKELITENRGTINVRSDPQSGTTFTILLPVAPEAGS